VIGMEYELSEGLQGHIYFPKKIRDILGKKTRISVGNISGIIYPEKADIDYVIADIEVLLQQLKLKK
jgi:hypothetical protein